MLPPDSDIPARATPTLQLARALEGLGCPADRSAEMASQLEKRATQLSKTTGKSHEEALIHLLKLMQQGWAAKERGL